MLNRNTELHKRTTKILQEVYVHYLTSVTEPINVSQVLDRLSPKLPFLMTLIKLRLIEPDKMFKK